MTPTAAEIEELRARLPRAFSPSPQERLRRVLVWGGAVVLAVYCLYRFGFFTWNFIDGILKFGSVVVAQLFPPTGWDQLPMFLRVMGETLAMAFLGTVLGAVVAFPLAFLAAGHMPGIGEYGEPCRQALDYVVTNAKPSGLLNIAAAQRDITPSSTQRSTASTSCTSATTLKGFLLIRSKSSQARTLSSSQLEEN